MLVGSAPWPFLDSLILSVHTNTVHLHFVSPDTHLELFHTLMIHHTQLILSLPSTHTRKVGVGCTLKIEVCMSFWKPWCAASWVQNPRFSESRVSVWRFSLCYVASPKPLAWIRERETVDMMQGGGQRGGVVGGAYFSRSGDLNIWSLLYWVWVTCTADLHFIPPFSKVASHNCGGREKSERNQCLHQYKQVLVLQLLLPVKLILD